MNAPSSKAPSKGMAMIAAYRAERLSQRPVLRSALHDSHVERRASRLGQPAPAEPVQPVDLDVTPPDAGVVEMPAVSAASVFAGLVSTAVAEQQNEALLLRDAEADALLSMRTAAFDDGEADADGDADADAGPADAVAAAEPVAAVIDAPVAPEPPYDPPLAEIGFGPGMLIRLSQLGLHTTRDLAQANAVQLRSELGDISRLVDVDAWIRSARQSSRVVPGDPSAGG